MLTQNNPTHCPSCESKDVYLGSCDYKKDEDGCLTDKVISGSWFCRKCGYVVGSYFKGTNDVDHKSI